MKCSCALRFVFGWVAVSAILASPVSAAIFLPGDSVPSVGGDVFSWSESSTNSTFASWQTFSTFPGGTAPGFLPAGTSPAPNSNFADGGTASSLTFESNQSIASSGNAYGGLFGPGDSSSFVTDAFATVRSGTGGGDFTRIVAQFATLGNELDYSSILLSTDSAIQGTIAPTLAIETDRTTLGGTFGGESVSYLALWDLASSQAEYRVDFEAAGNNLSLDEFRVDSFTQSAAFVSPSAVPEPSTFAALGMIAGGAWLKRRRRRTADESIATAA